jgi:transcriptional regulator with PAS, ATPase and Fis domain
MSNQVGKLKMADHGSVLLDEIGNLPVVMQPKLLRFLETQRFTPLGAKPQDTEEVDVRVISTANEDLNAAVADGTFRRDLLYRLGADFPIRLPSLREHPEDIPDLFEFFIKRMCEKAKRPTPRVDKEAYAFLAAFNWPGNVRQLLRTVERILLAIDASQAISADIAQSCIPFEPVSQRTTNDADQLFELRRQHAKVETYLDELQAAYVKAEQKRSDGKAPSLSAIGTCCNPQRSHSAISQFFTRSQDVIRQFSLLTDRWPSLRRLDQWPR